MSSSRYKNSHSNSRSPVPVGYQSPTSRPFLPPSHYAAAAGLSYPSDHILSTVYGSPGEHMSQSTSSLISPDAKLRNSFKQTSYASKSSHSDVSSFESNASLSAHPSASKHSKSRLGDLPALEAQLLPSLRDTINRMTRSPTRTSVIDSSSSRSPFLEPPEWNSHPTSLSSHGSQSNHGSSLRRPLRSELSSGIHSSPKAVWTPRSVPSTPVEQSTPEPKLKSALRSALKPPTPTNNAKVLNTPIQPPGVPARLAKPSNSTFKKTQIPFVSGSTSKMVADIKKGGGMASYGRVPSTNIENESLNTRIGRARSQTDPGSEPAKPETPAPAPTTPQLNSLYPSRLPRRIETPASVRHDSDSEIERHLNAAARSNWKLTIANGSASISSSSESDKEREPRTPEHVSKASANNERYTSTQALEQSVNGTRSPFGLGFGFGEYKTKFYTDLENSVSHEDEDDASVYEEDLEVSQQESLSETATLSSEDSVPGWENKEHLVNRGSVVENNSTIGSDEREESPDIHRTRRQALLGIVQGLDSGLASKSKVLGYSSSPGGEYHDQEIFAVGGCDEQRRSQGWSHKVDGSAEQDQWQHSHDNPADTTPVLANSPLPIFSVSSVLDRGRHGRTQHSPSPSPTYDRQRPVRPKHSVPLCYPVLHNDIYSTNQAEMRRSNDVDTGRRRLSRSPNNRVEISHTLTEGISDGQKRHVHGFKHQATERYRYMPMSNSGSSDISRLVEGFDAAAIRQREKFGIPRPISDFYTDSIHEVSSEVLSHSNSDLSSVGEGSWQQECEGLSVQAETLFKNLEDQTMSDRGGRQIANGTGVPMHDAWRKDTHQWQSGPSSESEKRISGHSGLDGIDDSDSQGVGQTWCSSLPSSVYRSLLDQHGELEIQRQEVIWELCETEETFISHLHSVIRLFVRPLRAQSRKSWIAGVPPEVARLFDWLEDIVNLHSKVSIVLHKARATRYSIVENLAESLKVFVPKFEVYQPYLARLEDTAALIERLMKDRKSDFGEFVTLQETSSDCQGWGLEKFLVEPVNRLAQYPDFFRRLLCSTPTSHPDYLATFSLLHSTNMIIRVMSEVKLREDEYDLVKEIASSILGLPLPTQLAKRERRLLTQGSLYLMSTHDQPPLVTGPSHIPSGRNSKLVAAINAWGSTATSFHSYDTTSSVSGYGAYQPLTTRPEDHLSKLKWEAGSDSDSRPLPHHMAVYAFIFTDIMVLVTPISGQPASDGCPKWRLLEKIGVSRVLNVTAHDEECSDVKASFNLQIVPMTFSELEKEITQNSPPVLPLRLSISRYSVGDIKSGRPLEFDERKTKWLSMLQRCAQFTLRSLSFLSHSGRRLDHGPDVDLELDTHQSVLEIMASGLPLPKSPSVQLDEAVHGEYASARQQEREERGWWSLRFQQVLREMQRQESFPAPPLARTDRSPRFKS